ncbi:LAGLIDADG family homing endonuclease [Niallia oryzisoli]|uniref:LAGLIDADG family homing endonuclease n=1 Tax=Niallia oryzisoli TaxID=1737571 RepID=A0ABZ2CHK6_9BACI
MGKLINLKGRIFGMYTVIDRVFLESSKNTIWLCKCNTCGNKFVKQSRHLLAGKGLTCNCAKDKPYKYKEQLKKMLLQYNDVEIGKMFNVKPETIKYFRKKFNLDPCPIKKSAGSYRIYTLDTQFFKEINTEYQAYILGFLTADGYVNKNGRNLAVAIKESDADILKQIKKAMGSNAILGTKRKPKNQEDLKVLGISSKEIVSDLVKFGIVPNKTKEITLPVLHKELYRHYIRGLWDGDGYIGKRQFALTGGSYMLLKQLQVHIYKETGYMLVIRELKKGDYVRGYQLYGSRRDKDVINWIYKSPNIVLERKYQSCLKYWS